MDGNSTMNVCPLRDCFFINVSLKLPLSLYSFSNTWMCLCVCAQVNSALECSFLLLKGPYDDVRIKPVIHHHSFSNDANETDYVPLPISDSVECNKLLAAKNINLRLFIFQVQK